MENLYCPKCNVLMIRRQSNFGKGNHWWGCPNWPTCTITAAEHPDGTMMSIPADDSLKVLKKEAHRLAEQVWGNWRTISNRQKALMYAWLKKNTSSGHIGLMQEDEVKGVIKALKQLLLPKDKRH